MSCQVSHKYNKCSQWPPPLPTYYGLATRQPRQRAWRTNWPVPRTPAALLPPWGGSEAPPTSPPQPLCPVWLWTLMVSVYDLFSYNYDSISTGIYWFMLYYSSVHLCSYNHGVTKCKNFMRLFFKPGVRWFSGMQCCWCFWSHLQLMFFTMNKSGFV